MMTKFASVARVTQSMVRGLSRLLSRKEYSHSLPRSGKRILIYNWRDLQHVRGGGAEMYIEQLARRWVKDGHGVTMFCGHDGGSALRHEIVDGVHVIRRGGQFGVYVWGFLYYLFRFSRGSYDIVIDCQNGLPFFTPLYVTQPVICVMHHVHQRVFEQHLPKPAARIAQFMEAKVMPVVYRHCAYVAVSPSTANEMAELGMSGKSLTIIYNGVALDELKPGAKSDQPSILFLGRLEAYKSVHVLIEAFAKLRPDFPDAELVIAGGGAALEELKRLTTSLTVQDNVTFTGRFADEQKVPLLQSAWVMVNPSMMEGWGITSVEANACGTPVIGADVPGLRDSIKDGETGSLVPYGDVAALEAVLRRYLTDAEFRNRMAAQAHDWAQQFSWDKSAIAFEELIVAELSRAKQAIEEVTA